MWSCIEFGLAYHSNFHLFTKFFIKERKRMTIISDFIFHLAEMAVSILDVKTLVYYYT
jgi:hypothetical protein